MVAASTCGSRQILVDLRADGILVRRLEHDHELAARVAAEDFRAAGGNDGLGHGAAFIWINETLEPQASVTPACASSRPTRNAIAAAAVPTARVPRPERHHG